MIEFVDILNRFAPYLFKVKIIDPITMFEVNNEVRKGVKLFLSSEGYVTAYYVDKDNVGHQLIVKYDYQ